MPKRINKEIVNERIKTKGIELIGEFKTTNTLSLFKCSNGHNWLARPYNIMSGRGCPECNQAFKFEEEYFNNDADIAEMEKFLKYYS